MKQIPTIQEYMTPMPVFTDEQTTVRRARQMMNEGRIRHLPVQRKGKLVGVITEKDVKVAEAFPGPGELSVGDVMSPNPYTTHTDTRLDDVVHEMAEHKYDCAVINDDDGRVVGIFTDIDALRAFNELLDDVSRSV